MLYNENIYEIPDHDDYPCKCANCGGDCMRSELSWSRDCHGITMRLLCVDCWHEIMDGIGYDGEEYEHMMKAQSKLYEATQEIDKAKKLVKSDITNLNISKRL